MKTGLLGRVLPALFDRVVYDYTARALPEIDIKDFRRKHKKEYRAMAARTPSVGSARENKIGRAHV